MNTGPQPPEVSAPTGALKQRFVARQPIFDRSRKVIGYELLFRNGTENFFQGEVEHASRSTIDSSLVLGLDTLCDGRRAFINCTTTVLLKDLITLSPPAQTVCEVLESVEPDDRVVAALQRLKQQGYTIALDDFEPNDRRQSLIKYADIVKIDLRATSQEQQKQAITDYGKQCQMLAEKVETQEEFRRAYEAGFLYFQGYFFRRPEIISVKSIPPTRVTFLRLLEMVSRPELDLEALERVFKQDASTTYRLLRFMNSAAFGFRSEIRSVRHALTILGEREVRRWVRLLVTLTASSEGSTELIYSALARARFCELVAEKLHSKKDLFLLGLLSLMDAILEVPMETILEHLPIDHETKAVLASQPSSLRPIYQLVLAQESGEWDRCNELATESGLNPDDASAIWLEALQWAQEISKGAPPSVARGNGA